MDCATDNGEARPLNSAAHRYNTGNWNAADNPLGFIWTNSYAQIRACNKFLENYHLIEEESGITTRLDIEYLRAQVIFLRAYFYSELLRAFGGVPLITKVLSMDDPEIKSERDSFKTILDFIVGECENAAELLKSLRGEDATRYGLFGGNFGRANEGIALALKAKVLLMAASPLFNRPADFSQYDSADPNVSLWRYPDYDRERWNTAAKALKDVIDLGFYDLYRAKTGTKTEYETLFRDSMETLVARAEQLGIQVVLEAISRLDSDAYCSVDETAEFIRSFRSPALTLQLDSIHLHTNGETDFFDLVVRAGDLIGQVDISDVDRMAPDGKHFDFPLLLRALKEAKFQDYLVFEFRAQPPADAAKAGLDYIRSLL